MEKIKIDKTIVKPIKVEILKEFTTIAKPIKFIIDDKFTVRKRRGLIEICNKDGKIIYTLLDEVETIETINSCKEEIRFYKKLNKEIERNKKEIERKIKRVLNTLNNLKKIKIKVFDITFTLKKLEITIFKTSRYFKIKIDYKKDKNELFPSYAIIGKTVNQIIDTIKEEKKKKEELLKLVKVVSELRKRNLL